MVPSQVSIITHSEQYLRLYFPLHMCSYVRTWYKLDLWRNYNYHCHYIRFMQLISLVPTDPTVLQRLGDMYEDSDKSQSFQYYLEVTTYALFTVMASYI